MCIRDSTESEPDQTTPRTLESRRWRKEVAAATVDGALQVLDSVKRGVQSVGADMVEAAVDVVGHRYGEQVHESGRQLGGAVTHLGRAFFHVGTLADNIPEAMVEFGAESADAVVNRQKYLGGVPLLVGLVEVRERIDPRCWGPRLLVLRRHALTVYHGDVSDDEIEFLIPVEDLMWCVPFGMLEAIPFDIDEHPLGIECATRDHAMHHWEMRSEEERDAWLDACNELIRVANRACGRPLSSPGPQQSQYRLSLIHISEPTRLLSISYAVFCLKKKKK
eukprot:TRINITY_DN22337_c0_g1_i2.p1 TRINITY_DN22337_c0_g1~~TRINITY_DN22337_c0_g1_i2.p1  ORF type:complete len:278 (-),score=75.85 TRINITY_DN22337_c0_g1_i2:96-929(-)